MRCVVPPLRNLSEKRENEELATTLIRGGDFSMQWRGGEH